MSTYTVYFNVCNRNDFYNREALISLRIR